MIVFFDYIFYRVFSFYKEEWSNDMPGFNAVLILSLMQSFNVISVLLAYLLIVQKNIMSIEVNKYHFMIIGFLILFFNVWRYLSGKRYNTLVEIWKNEDVIAMKRKGMFVLGYMILSTFFVLGAAIISGEINQGRL
jgi:signal transduction histidine kinase